MEQYSNTNLNPTTSQTNTTATSSTAAQLGVGFSGAEALEGVTQLTAPGPSAKASWTPSRILYPIQEAHNPLEMLSRPTQIATGLATASATTLAYSEVVDFRGAPAVTAARAILTGAYGIRATVCYRLEVAAAPQASGIYRMSVERLPPPTKPKSNARCVVSQLPGAEVNIADGSSATLRVPYVGDRDFWALTNPTVAPEVALDNFYLTLWTYSPIDWDTTTVSAPSWTLYRWLEDVQLVGQTSLLAAATPQAAEASEKKVGAVSSWLGFGSLIAGALATIPSLSQVATPARWALLGASRVASYFGYSKPYEGSMAGTMAMSYSRGVNTCADRDQLQPLAMFSTNELATSTTFSGCPSDEMSIAYIASRPGMIAQFAWKASDLAGTLKWTCPVTPAAFIFQKGPGGFGQGLAQSIANASTVNKVGFYPAPLLYVASNFALWRGGLCFRFKFARTKFHAGKLLIGFAPAADLTTNVTGSVSLAPSTTARYDYHSAIIDLRTTSEYDLMVPYVYPTPWCQTDLESPDYLLPTFIHSTGLVFVQAIDALYGPDNVPQNVIITVEVMGCPDFELAAPITPQFAPVYYDQSPAVVTVAQSNEPCPDTHGLTVCEHTVGERILSIKQMIARPLWCYANPTASAGSYRGTAIRHATPAGKHRFSYTTNGALPYKSPTYADTTVAGSLNSALIAPTIVAYYAMLYGLQRGSYVMRTLPANTTKSNAGGPKAGAAINTPFQSTVTLVPNNGSDARYAPLSVEAHTANGVNLPFYGKNDRIRTANSGGIINDVVYTPWLSISDNDSNCYLGISAGDDFQFGAFSGVPAVVFLDNPLVSSALPDQALNITSAFPSPA